MITRNTFYGTWVSAQPCLVTWCNVELWDAKNAGPENAGPENDGPNWIFVILSISGNSPCGSEVGHQISKESVERFKSYRNFKNAYFSML
jgi:hypothetical protein